MKLSGTYLTNRRFLEGFVIWGEKGKNAQEMGKTFENQAYYDIAHGKEKTRNATGSISPS